MKIYPYLLPIVASLFFATSLAAQLAAPPQKDKTEPPATGDKILLGKVMTDLPHYGETPVAVTAPKPMAEETTEVVHLAPIVIVGDKSLKLREPELRTKQAWIAEISKQYDHSAFSLFQHREDVRLQDMATLQNYADSLMLVGDVDGGRAIKKESSRLFLMRHDPESESIDTLFNPRVR